MRVRVRALAIALVAAAAPLVLGGCYKFTSFTCGSDTDCGTGGTCEAVGYCSFPDPTCAGGRFGEYSGPYANQCVGATSIDAAIDSPRADGPPHDVGGGGGAIKRAITIAAAGVRGAQTDFPVWIDVTDAGIAAHARGDASDVYFTDSTGGALDYQLAGYAAATGHLRAWVRVPQLSALAATEIDMHYGEATAAAPPNAPGVFQASFVSVWHLDDALVTNTVADATGMHDGTAAGLASTAQVAAQLGGGIAFGGSGEIAFTNTLAGSGASTISLWIDQPASTDDDQIIFAVGVGAANESRWIKSRFNGNDVAVGLFADDWTTSGVAISGTGWTMVDWVFDGGDSKSHLFINGAEIPGSPFTHAGVAATAGTAGYLGNAPVAWGNPIGLHATLDEVRIADTARAAGWIATEYANQSSPATFYTLGAEQTSP
jgi:hypothetical protein